MCRPVWLREGARKDRQAVECLGTETSLSQDDSLALAPLPPTVPTCLSSSLLLLEEDRVCVTSSCSAPAPRQLSRQGLASTC